MRFETFARLRTARPLDRAALTMRAIVAAAALMLAACGNTPPAPDWQMNAKSAMERAQNAYLDGDSRVEAVEFARARKEISSTGRADLVARIELARCATRVASLVFEDCSGFTSWAQDAPAAERAYASYLAGRAQPQDVALLPEQHRRIAMGGVPLLANLRADLTSRCR